MSKVQLYSYYRSSASYRVRIALNYKSIPYEYKSVHLIKNKGEQNSPEFRELNPMGEVPCLVYGEHKISQSMAIFNYLDDIFPERPLLFPKDIYKKAKIIEFCEHINAGIHPIQNLKVLRKLEREYKVDQEGKLKWAAYWIVRGFQALENLLQSTSGKFSFGNEITAADMFLCPQVYNAKRFGIDMSLFPLIERVDQDCLQLDAFRNAYPGVQPDTPNE
ncbi:MAG: maleylacetoacetate isomerase [Bdellovibrionaceae bacterium]|nr:maleylacetoacetate isomerase [Pseudobdellovibrionaceae bacterium]